MTESANPIDYHRLTAVSEVRKYQAECAFCKYVITGYCDSRSQAADEAFELNAVCITVRGTVMTACASCKSKTIEELSL